MNRRNTSNKRSLILTDSGLERLEAAIFNTLGDEYTYQQLSDLTDNSGGKRLDSDTISKIIQRKGSVYRSSLDSLFKAVGRQLQDSDYTYYQPPEPFDPNFVGREKAMQDLDNLVNQGKKAILIQAPGGVGKTTLAKYYLKQRGFDLVLDLPMAKEAQNITSAESVVEEWLRSDFQEEPGREFGIALKRLRDKLKDKRKKIAVLIDNLEPALEKGQFIPEHRKYVELLRVLTDPHNPPNPPLVRGGKGGFRDPDVESVTLITSRELLHEPGIHFEAYLLEGLQREAWQEFFIHNGIDTGNNPLNDDSALSEMHHAYEGNAEAMDILRGDMKTRHQRKLEEFWQLHREDLLRNPTLENLVQSQFNKLQRDYPEAYQLLCRLGCYRYQEVPVPEAGVLCLLWDVPEKRVQVLDALCFRGLVKFRNGEYYLHPVMRQEALDRLKSSEDWDTANRKVAEFWTDSVTTVETVDDALTAFEAYYHYVAINDFDKAAEVIIKPRKNKWDNFRSSDLLGRSLYRLGLFNKVSNMQETLKKLKQEESRCNLARVIGDCFWVEGNLIKAIEYHNVSLTLAQKNQYINLEIYAYINLGLCELDKGEYQTALIRFEKPMDLIKIDKIQKNKLEYEIDSWYLLAFIKSLLGLSEDAKELADKAYGLLAQVKDSWSQGYSRLFLGLTYKNLGELEKSRELYHSAIAYAEESHYSQVKAKALYGLAECDRLEEKFDTALTLHLESIEILENIGAKCDLAEAYYQLGLTQQKMGNPESQENFTKAIELFNDIGAPKQVEKVDRARSTCDCAASDI